MTREGKRKESKKEERGKTGDKKKWVKRANRRIAWIWKERWAKDEGQGRSDGRGTTSAPARLVGQLGQAGQKTKQKQQKTTEDKGKLDNTRIFCSK